MTKDDQPCLVNTTVFPATPGDGRIGLDVDTEEVDDLRHEGGAMTFEPRTSVEQANPLQSGMTRAEIVAFFKRRQEAFEDLDAKALAADYTDDSLIESPSTGVHKGRDAEKALRTIFDAFLDITMSVDDLIIDGDVVVTIHSCEGTQMGELLGFAPTGKRFQMSMAFVHRLKDRKIIHERRIYDFTGMLVQIGVLKAKPA
jgi:predicted ester cyclase